MPSAQQVLEYAASQIGNNGRPYTQQYGWADNTPWCALFQSNVGDHFGAGSTGFNASAAVSGIVGQLARVDDRVAVPGDLVAFNWDGRSDLGWMDHIGIIEWSGIGADYNGLFGTIEGNTGSNSNLTSKVLRVTRNNNAGYFTAFFRPAYDSGSPVPSPSPSPAPSGDGVIYQVHTHAHGWLDVVNWAGNGDDGYAGWQGSPIDGIKAYREDGQPLRLNTHMNGVWLGETTFAGGLWGSNSSGDGYSGNIGAGFIDGIQCYGADIRVATNGDYFGWMINGQTPEGDGYAGDFGSAITKVQMKA